MNRYSVAILLFLVVFIFPGINPIPTTSNSLREVVKISVKNCIQVVFAQEPPAAESLLEEGIGLFRAGKFKEAINVLKEFTASVPDNYLSHYYLGFSYFRTGDSVLAKEALIKSVSLNPDFVPAHMGLGAIYETEGDLENAIEEYKAVVERSREQGEVKGAEARLRFVELRLASRYMNRAQLMTEENDLDSAINELLKAVELTPRDISIYIALGRLYVRQNKMKEVREIYEKAKEKAPENPELLMVLGEIYFNTDFYDKAIKEFNEVIRLVPDSELAKKARGKLKDVESKQKSRVLFEEISRAVKEEKFDEALSVISKLQETEPDNPFVHYNLGVIYLNKKMYSESIASLERAIELYPEYVNAFYQLAVVYDDIGRYDKAMMQYEAVVKMGKEGVEETQKAAERLKLLKELTITKEVAASVRELMEAGKYEESVIEAERILTVKEDEETLFTLGKIYLLMKNYEKVIGTFDRVIKMNPNRWEAYLFMGQGYEALKRLEEATISYNKVVSNVPETTEGETAKKMLTRVRIAMHFKKAHDYREKGDLEGALREIESLLQKEPGNPVALFNAGVLYYLLQKQDRAITYLNKTLEIEPRYVSAQLQLGFVYESQRKYRDAEAAYNAVLSLTNEGREAEIARNRLGLLDKEEAFSTRMSAAQKLIGEGKFEQALVEAKEITAIAPENYIAHYTIGYIYDSLKMFDEAISSFQKAIDVSPKYHNAYFGLARVYEQQGFYEEAREAYRLTMSNGEGTKEAAFAAASLKRLRPWYIQAYLSNTVSEVKTSAGQTSSGTNSIHGLTLSYDLYRTKIRGFNLTTAVNNNIYYESQLTGVGYRADLRWNDELSSRHAYTAGGGYSYSVFDNKPSNKVYRYFASATLKPEAIPTYVTMRYDYSDTVNFVYSVGDMIVHNLSFSITQKTSDWDTVSGSYTYAANLNKHPLGNNFAHRSNNLYLNYNKRIIPQVYLASGYNIGFRNYMNADSTTLFTEFRKDVIHTLNLNLSYRLSDKGFLYLKGSNTWESTNIPSLKEEELVEIGERLADPIPRVGGWDRRRTTTVSADMSYRLSEMVYLTGKIGRTWATTDPENVGSYRQYEFNVSLQAIF